jgi:flagellar biosynthetic protein FliR
VDALTQLLGTRGLDDAALLVLLCARLVPLVWLVPWVAARGVPVSVSLALTWVLALCLWPVASASAPALTLSLARLSPLVLRELLIGLVYALALALPLRAFEWAGQLAGGASGVRGADTAYGSLQLWLAVAVFFALGGQRVAIAALADGITTRPLGTPSALSGLRAVALSSVQLLGDAFASALLIALPVVAALALADLAVVLVARAASANALPLALAPARPALALLLLWIWLLLLPGLMPDAFEQGLHAARRLWAAP